MASDNQPNLLLGEVLKRLDCICNFSFLLFVKKTAYWNQTRDAYELQKRGNSTDADFAEARRVSV